MPVHHEHEFELYHYGESISAQMPMVALIEKQIPFKLHEITLESTGEHLTKDYRNINPKALVPVLVHNGEPIYDTWTIIKYLDDYAPDRGARLWPMDAESREQIGEWMREFGLDESIKLGENFGSCIALSSTYLLAYILKTRPISAVIWDYLTKHPDRVRKFVFVALRLMPEPPKALYSTAIKGIAKGLVSIEQQLFDGRDYLLGDYSAADVMLTAHLHRIEDVALDSIFRTDELKRTNAYWERIKARPRYDEGILKFEKEDWRNAIAAVYGEKPNPHLPALLDEIKRLLSDENNSVAYQKEYNAEERVYAAE
ncbi:MAG: glutathione S-transferase family protein [Pseudomonadota bacterium]